VAGSKLVQKHPPMAFEPLCTDVSPLSFFAAVAWCNAKSEGEGEGWK